MPDKRIVLFAGTWDTTPIVYNFLSEHFTVYKVIIEDKVPRKEFLKRRIKKLGWITVAGQVAFQLTIARILSLSSKKRISDILQQHGLKRMAIPSSCVVSVPSVNSDECLRHLKLLQPDVVVVHGTRIISKKILNGTSATFLNIHAGITPRYRGSHGAYWALANNDSENCGVTVHLVDAGVDTGNIIAQERIPITPQDNFITYGYLQLAMGLQLLREGLQKLFSGGIKPVQNQLNSALWYHPTLWSYLYKRITRGVK